MSCFVASAPGHLWVISCASTEKRAAPFGQSFAGTISAPYTCALLSESLIAFRLPLARLAWWPIAARIGAPVYGRNEAEGSCRGWKLNVTGACVDMPSEPPESNFERGAGVVGNCVERGGIISTCTWERARHRRHSRTSRPIWTRSAASATMLGLGLIMQALEGDIDTAHFVACIWPLTLEDTYEATCITRSRTTRATLSPTRNSVPATAPIAAEDTYLSALCQLPVPCYTRTSTGHAGSGPAASGPAVRDTRCFSALLLRRPVVSRSSPSAASGRTWTPVVAAAGARPRQHQDRTRPIGMAAPDQRLTLVMTTCSSARKCRGAKATASSSKTRRSRRRRGRSITVRRNTSARAIP